MTSSNGNIFRVNGHLCGEFTGHRWIPRTKASDAELWLFFHLLLNKRLSEQWRGWWFETPSRPLWRHCNGVGRIPLLVWRVLNRKYKDYVYRKMLVQEYLKKWRIFKRVKPKNDMMYHDIYNCICQNTKKLRFVIHYVKPTAQLLFRIRFPKGGPTCRRQYLVKYLVVMVVWSSYVVMKDVSRCVINKHCIKKESHVKIHVR